MAESILAIQKGLDFQSKFFWCKACRLYLPNSNVVQVSWEIDTVGFDDVALYYSPAMLLSNGDEITQEYFQVKFHVDQSQSFTCEALTNPEFIGATSESLLQKLKINYEKSPDTYGKSLYHIVNTWGLDRKDELKNLLDGNGAIILNRLFDGTTDRSKTGKIRKCWREHLGLSSDDELKRIISQLRITYDANSGERIVEDMNFRLYSVGLETVDESKRVNKYPEIIRRLHMEKKNRLGKEQFRQILHQENLWVSTSTQVTSAHYRIGVRSFLKGTDSIEAETDEYLCLLHHFDGRYVLDEALWQKEILPALDKLAKQAISKGKPILMHLDTHLSTAFAMGYLIDSKCGVEVSVVQKTRGGGRIIMRPSSKPVDAVPNWNLTEESINANGEDVVLSVNVTHDISSQVKEYILKEVPNASKIINALMLPSPSGSAIRDADHIVQAVEELNTYLRTKRSMTEKSGNLHLFMAVPNAFAFSFGQYGRSLGKIKLYEFDFENLRSCTYQPAISLP